MTRTAVLSERLDLLKELQSIDVALNEKEQQLGACVAIEDARRRVTRARECVLAQLRGALIGNGAATVH